MLENRRRIGFDAGLTRRQTIHELPAPQGLLITHIDMSRRGENNQDNADESRRLVDVEEASPIMIDDAPVEHLDIRHDNDWLNLYNGNRGDNGDLWPGFSEHNEDSTSWVGSRDRTTFGSNSIPSSFLYNGRPSHVQISNIRSVRSNDIMCDILVDDTDPYLRVKSYRLVESDNETGFVTPGSVVELFVTLENI